MGRVAPPRRIGEIVDESAPGAGHRVLVVEDDEPTRARLARAVAAHPELALQEAVAGVAAARALLERDPPDVLLTDLDLPDGNGIELIRCARALGGRTQSMVISIFGDEQHVVAAIEAGALGYLLKDASSDAIGRSILEMLEGGSPMSPPVARYLLQRFAQAAPAATPATGAVVELSAREREVLTYIVKGFSYAEIARLLSLSTHTVATHVRRIYGKLEVHSRGEAVYEALATGLVKMDDT
ncbi:MAG: DNA-binding response regulator [Proteobacteria bacterium]|nr:MAG: DNA-binding response regulator [Pseudomonadota bacterium]